MQLEPMRALVVEDDVEVRKLFALILRGRGYEVAECAEAETALARWQRSFFALNVLDWGLPGMNGLELCRRIRALPGGDRCLILMMTGRTALGALQTTLDAGADDYLPKPMRIEALNIRLTVAERRLHSLLAQKRADEALLKAQAELEERVEARTRELQASNAALRREIAQRKEAEASAELRQQQLIQADKLVSLGTLVSGVAHEVNSPNQHIMTHLAPLRRIWAGALPILDRYFEQNGDFVLGGAPYLSVRDEVPEMLSAALHGSERIKAIVDELRQFARERPARQVEAVNINPVIESAITLLAPMVARHTDRFVVDLAEDLPPVNGDYQRLEQVVINLVLNACQALPHKRRAVRVATEYAAGEQRVVIRVEDEGKGIPADLMERVVDPFFTTRRDAGGTGLGLSISSSIIAEHGGTLNFTSEPERGTQVHVSLPAGLAAGAEADSA